MKNKDIILSTFKKLEVDDNIYSIIIGEGLFDNGISIVLY